MTLKFQQYSDPISSKGLLDIVLETFLISDLPASRLIRLIIMLRLPGIRLTTVVAGTPGIKLLVTFRRMGLLVPLVSSSSSDFSS